MDRAPASATYQSKRDGWLVAVLIVAAVANGIAAVQACAVLDSPWLRLLTAVPLVGVSALMLWILYGTRYTLTDRELRVRSGPFRWTVPLEAIHEASPTRNPLSSPACSLDRLNIVHGPRRRRIMISPFDKGRFLDDLVARSPGLRRDGEGVFRAA